MDIHEEDITYIKPARRPMLVPALLVAILIAIVASRWLPKSTHAGTEAGEGSAIMGTITRFTGGPGSVDAVSVATDGESRALKDGRILREGDLLDGFKVSKINLNTVEFQKSGQTFIERVGK